MAEDDTSMEHVQEHIHHEAHKAHEGHDSHGSSESTWIGWAALTAAIFAALAAIGGALSSEHLNESNHSRIKSNDQWAYYQAKSIKTAVLYAKEDLLKSLIKAPFDDDAKKISDKDLVYIAKYEDDMKDIMKEAQKMEGEADTELTISKTFEHGVTLFHISIAVVAIAVLTKRKRFWYVSMGFAAIGLAFVIYGFIPH